MACIAPVYAACAVYRQRWQRFSSGSICLSLRTRSCFLPQRFDPLLPPRAVMPPPLRANEPARQQALAPPPPAPVNSCRLAGVVAFAVAAQVVERVRPAVLQRRDVVNLCRHRATAQAAALRVQLQEPGTHQPPFAVIPPTGRRTSSSIVSRGPLLRVLGAAATVP